MIDILELLLTEILTVLQNSVKQRGTRADASDYQLGLFTAFPAFLLYQRVSRRTTFAIPGRFELPTFSFGG